MTEDKPDDKPRALVPVKIVKPLPATTSTLTESQIRRHVVRRELSFRQLREAGANVGTIFEELLLELQAQRVRIDVIREEMAALKAELDAAAPKPRPRDKKKRTP